MQFIPVIAEFSAVLKLTYFSLQCYVILQKSLYADLIFIIIIVVKSNIFVETNFFSQLFNELH